MVKQLGQKSEANCSQVIGHLSYPMDREVHTENTEDLWMRAKRKLCRQFGTSCELFPLYLHEFVFHNKFRDQCMFVVFLKIIGGNYPVWNMANDMTAVHFTFLT